MSIDFKLDLTTQDITFKDGKFIPIVDTGEEARQRIQIRLKAWENEWFLDNSFGLPYREEIIKKGVEKADLDVLILEVVNEVELVQEVTNFSSIFLGRTYLVRFSVIITGNTIVNPRGSDNVEWEYPDPNVSTPILPCLDTPDDDPSTYNLNLVYTISV